MIDITLDRGTTSADLPARLTPGMWRIARRDAWQYDAAVVSALHALATQPGVEMIDPTGLLGGSRYGFDINREESAPIVQRTNFKTRSPAEPPQPRPKRVASVTRMMRDRDLRDSS